MKLNEYQRAARSTDQLPPDGMAGNVRVNELRLAAGVSDEAGEVLGKYKKAIRDSDERLDDSEIIDELGDVLWYVALLADELDTDLGAVARRNLDKLNDRQTRGVLAGSGDRR